MFRGRILDAFENYGFFSHRSAYKSLLPRECRGSALSHHPKFLALMCFTPCEIVMIVNFFQDLCAQNPRHPLAYPVRMNCIFLFALATCRHRRTRGEFSAGCKAPAEHYFLVSPRPDHVTY